MTPKMPIAVLISGSGRTLKNIMDHIDAGKLDVEIKLVIASTPNASGLQYAEKANIPISILESADCEGDTKEERIANLSDKIFNLCRQLEVDYVVYAGYVSTLRIPEDFENRVLNIHPSLLSAFSGRGFYGRSVHEAALSRGVKKSGCTVHFVTDVAEDEQIGVHVEDEVFPVAGPIIRQIVVPVEEDDVVDTLSDRVLYDAEFVAYPEALQLLAEKRIVVETVEDGDATRQVVRILPPKESCINSNART